MSEKKELPNEARILLAFVLSMAILFGWSYFYKPPKPPAEPQPAATQPAPAQAPSTPTTGPAAPAAPKQTQITAAAALPIVAKAATEEQTIVVENGLYRVEFSNRGGVVRSWQLLKYTDDSKPPRTLDMVDTEAAQQLGVWPLSIGLEDGELQAKVNGALFVVTPASGPLRAPAEITFEWSDGHLSVTKRLRFSKSYGVELDTSVTQDGQLLGHSVAWRAGFGDVTAYSHEQQILVVHRALGKLQRWDFKKLGDPDKGGPRYVEDAQTEYAGIEDRYFAAVFLPRTSDGGITTGLTLWHWKTEREKTVKDKKEKVNVPEMSVGSLVPKPLALHLFVGPKDFEVLGQQRPPMTELVDFGWFGIVAEPLFRLLKWIYHYVPNYGWAIILMTIGINMLLFPLKLKSWRSMQKMQRVMPEVQAIKQKYAKYSMRDPRKQQEQQEMMAVYKREGINPMGGCLPMLLQMPIWMALYQMLNATIELRHAPWLGWIRDLASPDPYYILPVLMGVTMYVMQKMTPVTTADPAQQKMMTFMPLMFGGMFVIFPVSSGLVLYILASNLVGMGQQWYLNKSAPVTLTNGHKKKT